MHLIVLTYTTCCLDVHAQVIVPSRELASKHYAEHDGKPFFPKLVDFLSSGAVVVRWLCMGCCCVGLCLRKMGRGWCRCAAAPLVLALFRTWVLHLQSFAADGVLCPPPLCPGPPPSLQAMVFEGKEVVKTGRAMIGATNPLASAPGTIRGDLAVDMGRNIIHGSDSVDSAMREIALWFKADELADYEPVATTWIYE
jgi:nucleoside diphosphate kinase